MSDQELLLAAAKAAGYARMKYMDDMPYVSTAMNGDHYSFNPWNPLTDDGDALRLAIKLRERRFVEINLLVGFVSVDLDNGDWFREDYNDDPCAATRRAIVRAAAAIASAVPDRTSSTGA